MDAVKDNVFKDKATASQILDQIHNALDNNSSPDVSFPRVFVKNRCHHPIEVLVYYLAGNNEPESWHTSGWFGLYPGQKNTSPIPTTDIYIFMAKLRGITS